MEKCYFCKREFETKGGLLTHVSVKHKIKHDEYKVLTEHNNVWPICKCGCGEKVNWSGELKSFCDYKRGHISRIHNNWGHNKKAIEKSSNTRKKLASDGKWKVWNDGKSYEELKGKEWSDNFTKQISDDKERNSKISKSLKGKKKSPEHVKKMTKHMQEYWSDPTHRDEQRERRLKYIEENGFVYSSKLEDKFASMLTDLGIEFTKPFRVGRNYYDFKIKDQNILIETDGDYWHCNPNTKYKIPVYKSQKYNIELDKKKNQIAKDNNYTLLRFWEDDINNHPAKVVKTLLNEIKV